MNNEVVLVRALNSAPYDDAVAAIKLFLRSSHKERVATGKLAAALQISTSGAEHERVTDGKGRDWYVQKKNSYPSEHQPAKVVAGTDSLSTMLCSKCGDSLVKSTVCPGCKDGQSGFKIKYSCTCGLELLGRKE